MGPDVPRATWVRGPPPGASSSRPRFFCEVLPTWAPGARTAALLHWPRAGSGRLGRCLTVRTWRGAVPALERPRPPRQRPLSRVCGTRALLRPDNDRGPFTLVPFDPARLAPAKAAVREDGRAPGRASAGLHTSAGAGRIWSVYVCPVFMANCSGDSSARSGLFSSQSRRDRHRP
jgi:hypothetical protein